eukprot:Em0009g1256a
MDHHTVTHTYHGHLMGDNGPSGVHGASGKQGAPSTTGVVIVVSREQSLMEHLWRREGKASQLGSTWYHWSRVVIVVSREGKASQGAPGTTGVAMVVSRRQSKYQEGEM